MWRYVTVNDGQCCTEAVMQRKHAPRRAAPFVESLTLKILVVWSIEVPPDLVLASIIGYVEQK
jgi:hypothetical protein